MSPYSLHYTERAPSPEVAMYVDSYRTLRWHGTALSAIPTQVIPSGHLNMLFLFGPSLNIPDITPLGTNFDVHTYFAGPMDNTFNIKLTGHIDLLDVRFKRGYGAMLTQHALYELSHHNAVLTLDTIMRPEQMSLVEQLATTSDVTQRILLFERWLLQVIEHHTILDSNVLQALDLINRSRGRLSINDLTQTIGVSQRQLARQFATYVGLSPKRLARIVRIRHALALLQQPETDWPAIIDICGFYDQAHFIRDFKAVLGSSPGAYQQAFTHDRFLQYNTPSL